MLRCTARRLSTSFLLVLSLLFAQLALAAYVCPTGTAAASPPTMMEMAPGVPCEGMAAAGEDQSALCHQHCTDAPQGFEPLKPPTASQPGLVQGLTVPPAPDASGRQPGAPAAHAAARPPPEPVFLSTLRLRV